MLRSRMELIPAPQSVSSQRFPTREVCGLILFFWIALLPFSINYLIFHPDERHYTDAGIIMHQTHDYLTPRNADGSPRFLKPILTYWLVALGFQLGGITPAAARLPFLLLGGGCILLGSIIAHRLFRERRTTLLTAAILIINPLIGTAALATLPDIVQGFFILLSACGWIGLLKNGYSKRDAACAFLGAGLAVATKGVPGLLLTFYSLCFLTWNPWKRLKPRHLLPVGWVATASGIALFWYLHSVALHGDEAIRQFIGDQVHSRLTRRWWDPLLQLPSTPFLYVILIGPTFILLLTVKRKRLQQAWQSLTNEQQACMLYISGWGLLLFPLLAFINPFTVRYFLLVVPLFTPPFAWVIAHTAYRPLGLFCRFGTYAVTVGIGLILMVRFSMSVVEGYPFEVTQFLLLVGLTAAIVAQLWWHRRRSVISTSAIASQALLLLVASLFWLIAPLTIPDQAREMADILDRINFDHRRHELWYVGKPIMTGKLRVENRGELEVHSTEAPVLYHLPPSATIIISRLHVAMDQLDPEKYLFYPISDGWRDLSPLAMAHAWSQGELREYFSTRREVMVISIPRIALEEGTVTLKGFEESAKGMSGYVMDQD